MNNNSVKFGILFALLILSIFTACYDPKEVPVLIKKLHSSDPKVRNDAALRLGYMGSPMANKATSDLIPLLTDENVGVQSAAAYALRRIDTTQARAALDRANIKR